MPKPKLLEHGVDLTGRCPVSHCDYSAAFNPFHSTLPQYLSPSQISTLLTCGEQYRLTRVEKAPERPMFAGIGGSAVHKATEDLDRERYASEHA